jgi:hypothetical protein
MLALPNNRRMKMNLPLNLRGVASLLVSLLVVVMAALESAAYADGQRMNVLFITADDLGLQLGCYGETLIETPNLDRLAASSTQFDVAYVAQASCSPSRSSMFTGLHTHSTGQFGLTNGGFALHSELRDRTIPNLLHKVGYRTGIIGKLHVDPEASFKFGTSREAVETHAVKVADALQGVTRLFLDTAPVIYYVERNPKYAPAAGCDALLTNDAGLKRVQELTILVLDELEV